MEYPHYDAENNKNKDGYKVTGDGNAPNSGAKPGNESFSENPHSLLHDKENDIPEQLYNINDKAYHDSSKEDFTFTVSNFLHAHQTEEDDASDLRVDMQFKTPDGDR